MKNKFAELHALYAKGNDIANVVSVSTPLPHTLPGSAGVGGEGGGSGGGGAGQGGIVTSNTSS